MPAAAVPLVRANYTHGAILHRASVSIYPSWVAGISIMERAGSAVPPFETDFDALGGIARADRLPHKARDRHGGIAAGASLRLNP